jgi:hypothetical protein
MADEQDYQRQAEDDHKVGKNGNRHDFLDISLPLSVSEQIVDQTISYQ